MSESRGGDGELHGGRKIGRDRPVHGSRARVAQSSVAGRNSRGASEPLPVVRGIDVGFARASAQVLKEKPMVCVCGKERGPGDRLPKGWKRSGESVYCADCWRRMRILRAISMPVAEIMDGTWEEFRASVREMWAATTQCSNWMMTQLYARDVRRNGELKLPPMAPVYLYPEARARFPQLPSQSVSALDQMVQAKYRAARYQVIWTCAASLPTFRYPTPFSSPNQTWTLRIEDERPVVSARVGDRRWSLRLKSGPRYRRQLTAVRKIADGSADRGSLDLYEQKIDGKPAVMCKMVAWLPRRERPSKLEGALSVWSTAESLLVAVKEDGNVLWTYHADQLRRWSAEHREQLQRWADDARFERRPMASFTARREAAARKYRNRMNSAVREIAGSLAGYAARRKFAMVRYDDRDTSFCPGFPWSALRERIGLKLDEIGIEFDSGSGGVPRDS